MSDVALVSEDESPDCSVTCAVLENVTWADWSTCSYDEDVAVFRFHYVDYTVNEPDWQSLLQPDEIERARRYRREEDRYRSLYTRSLLRILVGKYINQLPSAIQFTVGITKKPELQDSTDWHVNVAHSGDWILLAIAKVSVGVDVEEILLNFPYQDVVAYSFSESERQYIEADEQNQLRFYQLWTRKEALVKATAKGIDDDFSQIPSLIGFHQIADNKIGAAGAWTTTGFAVADDYLGAIAYKHLAKTPQFYTLDRRFFNR